MTGIGPYIERRLIAQYRNQLGLLTISTSRSEMGYDNYTLYESKSYV